jgi:hypothetical protein
VITMGETNFSSWGVVIFLIILFIAFTGGNFGGWGNRGGNQAFDLAALANLGGGCNRASNCEVMRQEIIDTATTQYKVESNARQVQDVVTGEITALGSKIDGYFMAGLRDKLNEANNEIMMLKNQLYSDARFGALEQQISQMSARMLKQPEMSGIVAVCPDSAVYRGNSCGC